MLTYKDVGLLDNAFSGLDDTLMRNRMMKQEQQRQQQEQTRLSQNEQNLNQYRQASLGNKEDEQKILNELAQARLNDSKQKDDTKASKVWYYISPNTRNVKTFAGTPEEAQKHLQDIQSHTGNEQIQMTDKEPDSLKDLNEIPIDDKNTLYASDADAVKYYSQKSAAQAKANKPVETGSQSVHQVQEKDDKGNPMFDAVGQPMMMNETNTTSKVFSNPPQAALSGPATHPPARVKVKDSTGKMFTVPQEQLQDAINQGYSQVQ